jgi:hypothetical protein
VLHSKCLKKSRPRCRASAHTLLRRVLSQSVRMSSVDHLCFAVVLRHRWGKRRTEFRPFPRLGIRDCLQVSMLLAAPPATGLLLREASRERTDEILRAGGAALVLAGVAAGEHNERIEDAHRRVAAPARDWPPAACGRARRAHPAAPGRRHLRGPGGGPRTRERAEEAPRLRAVQQAAEAEPGRRAPAWLASCLANLPAQRWAA